jgi:transposase InsO family protein
MVLHFMPWHRASRGTERVAPARNSSRCSRKVVGCDVRDTMPEDRMSKALYRLPAGLVPASDQGSQYTATRFWQLAVRHGAVPSMSRRGNCSDNAPAESFWSRFKAEYLDGGRSPARPNPRSKPATTWSTTTPNNVTQLPIAQLIENQL